MSKNKITIISLVAAQIVLTWISLSWEASPLDFLSAVLMPILVGAWAYIFAVPAFFVTHKFWSLVYNITFYTLSVFNIGFLLFLTFFAIKHDGMREAGLLFLGFPIIGSFVTVGGIIVGIITYFVKTKIKKTEYKILGLDRIF